MKVDTSSQSLMQGVSEQVPHRRQGGQLTEQVNLVPDPVVGLARRHGTQSVLEAVQPGLSIANLSAYIADTATWTTFEYANGGREFIVLLRRTRRPVGAEALPAVIVYDRTNSTFLNVVKIADAYLELFEVYGCSAVTSIGRLMIAAGNGYTATGGTIEVWGEAANKGRSVAWVRQGAYNRAYSVTIRTTAGVSYTGTYTTMTSNYQGTLDTSGVTRFTQDPDHAPPATTVATESPWIVADVGGTGRAGYELAYKDFNPVVTHVRYQGADGTNVWPATPAGPMQYAWDSSDPSRVYFDPAFVGSTAFYVLYNHYYAVTNPNYQNIINKLTQEYNTAVTKWIGDAAESITPGIIATRLLASLRTAGYANLGAFVKDSTICFPDVESVTMLDGGDGSLVRAVAQTVSNIDQVSTQHYVGKVIKVQPANSPDYFYLRAVAQDGTSSGWASVTWVEGAGQSYYIAKAFIFGVAVGNTFYLGASASAMNAAVPGLNMPAYVTRTVGDNTVAPPPFFLGNKITYLGVFQDRLLVGSGATVRASRVGDYLNFFRTSLVSTIADDSVEFMATGTDDDDLRYGVTYNRDLVIFGNYRQYIISGRQTLSPTTALIQTLSEHRNAGTVQPRAVGSTVFYAQPDTANCSVHGIMPSQTGGESPDSFNVSTQLAKYLVGNAVEFKHVTRPTHLFLRTDKAPHTIFVYTFMDKQQGGRVQEAWHRWDFNPALGQIIGMSPVPEGLLIFYLRTFVDSTGFTRIYLAVDRQSMVTQESGTPYLDSQRPAGAGAVPATTAGWWTAYSGGVRKYIGDAYANGAALDATYPDGGARVAGVISPAYMVPTNPYAKDNNGNALLTGLFTVTRAVPSFQNSAGFVSTITEQQSTGPKTFTKTVNARVIGDPANYVGRQIVTDYEESIPIGRETRKFDLTIAAQTWLPFTLTALEQVGQFFHRPQRM